QAQLEQARKDAAEKARVETEQRLAREAKEAQEKADREAAAKLRAEQLKPAKDRLLAFADQVEQLGIPDIWSGTDVKVSLDAAHNILKRAADEFRVLA